MLLDHSDAASRRLACYRAARRPKEEDRLPLERLMLHDRDTDVRTAAAYALKALAAPASLPALVLGLHDPDFGVRSQAAWALVALGAPVREKVAPLLRSANPDVSEMAAIVLARLDDPYPTWIARAVSLRAS